MREGGKGGYDVLWSWEWEVSVLSMREMDEWACEQVCLSLPVWTEMC